MRILSGLVLALLLSPLANAQAIRMADDEENSRGDATSSFTEVDAGFVVRSYRGGPDQTDVATKCRMLRQEWSKQWLSGRSAKTWTTPCEIVVHAHRQSYLASVGRAGVVTVGSSLVRRNSDGSVTRRIDLLPANDGELTALAHELVHVILADHFPDGLPPLWIDEGLAMLMDAPQKQARHWRDCDTAMQTGQFLPLQQLVSLDRSPSSGRFPALYGQSLALTRFLTEKGEPETLLAFVIHAGEHGYPAALQIYYGIRSWEDFESQWRAFMASRSNAVAAR